MKEDKCTLTDLELLKKCEEWIDSLCKTGARAWSLSVPVNFNRDPDMLFSELISRYTHSLLKDKDIIDAIDSKGSKGKRIYRGDNKENK